MKLTQIVYNSQCGCGIIQSLPRTRVGKRWTVSGKILKFHGNFSTTAKFAINGVQSFSSNAVRTVPD